MVWEKVEVDGEYYYSMERSCETAPPPEEHAPHGSAGIICYALYLSLKDRETFFSITARPGGGTFADRLISFKKMKSHLDGKYEDGRGSAKEYTAPTLFRGFAGLGDNNNMAFFASILRDIEVLAMRKKRYNYYRYKGWEKVRELFLEAREFQ